MVEVSNPGKTMFPERSLTKADLVAHYESVAERMLPFVTGRPLTLQRFPDGIGGKGFMQKNASKHFPTSIARFEVPKNDGGVTTYPVVDRADDLAYLANQGTVTFHVWTATAADPDHPDWLVIDLDPDGDDLAGVRRATETTRQVLARFDLVGFPMATGSSGFHVWVRLDGAAATDDVALASRALAGLVALEIPEVATTEFLKKDRSGRVFVDWLRNTPGATVVAPFSLRPRPTAPVAVPLAWDELADAAPDGWTLGALEDRSTPASADEPLSLPTDEIVAVARADGVDLDSSFDRFGRRR